MVLALRKAYSILGSVPQAPPVVRSLCWARHAIPSGCNRTVVARV